jgi:hypothetical protein
MKRAISFFLASVMCMSMFTGCSGNKEPEFEYDINKAASDLVTEMNLNLTPGNEDYLEYMEIEEDWYEEACVYYAPISTSVELVFAAKAKDKASAQKILDILDKRKAEISAAQENYDKVLAAKAMAGTAVVREDIYILFAIAGEEADYRHASATEAMAPVIEAMENVFEAQKVALEYKARNLSGEQPDVDNQI